MDAFTSILALIALKELLNMNRIQLFSVPGLISAIGLILILLPQDFSWVPIVQQKITDRFKFYFIKLYRDVKK